MTPALAHWLLLALCVLAFLAVWSLARVAGRADEQAEAEREQTRRQRREWERLAHHINQTSRRGR